eukprot:tig00021119_g18425.t1
MAGRALKETVVLVVDVGASMARTKFKDGRTYVQLAQEAMRSFVEQKILYAKKDEVGVLLFGSRATDNDLAEELGEGNYENIQALQKIEVPKTNLLKRVESLPPGGKRCDFIDAIVVAMDMLIRKTRTQRNASTRIVLLTDAFEAPSEAAMETILSEMKAKNMGFLVMGLGFAEVDDDNNFVPGTGTQADPAQRISPADVERKRKNEMLLRQIADSLPEGSVLTIHEALGLLSGFRSRTVRQTSKARFGFGIGLEMPAPPSASGPGLDGPAKVGHKFRIPLWSFTKTAEMRYPSFKLFNKEKLESMTPEERAAEDAREQIKVMRSMRYKLRDVDPTKTDERDTDVEVANLEYAFSYGRDKVKFHKDEYKSLKYKTGERHAELIGFVPAASVPRHYFKSGADLWVPEPGNERAAVAASSLARAMEERAAAAVVRFVYQKDAPVKMGALYPRVKAGYEGFVFVQLPFAEDIRELQFEDFARDARRGPSGEQLAAAEALIRAMDLTSPAVAADAGGELLKPKNTFNPALQRLYRTLPARALDPTCPVPVEDERLARMVDPSEEVLPHCAKEVERFRELFPLAKIEKAARRGEAGADGTPGAKRPASAWDAADADGPDAKRARDAPAATAPIPSQELRIDSIMAEGRRPAKVTSEDPRGSFEAIIGDRSRDRVEEAVSGLSEVILRLLEAPRGSAALFRKVADALAALREGCVTNEEPRRFNEFLRRLKALCLEGPGPRREFWEAHVVAKDVSLITGDEVYGEAGSVTPDEARQFIGKLAPGPEAGAGAGAGAAVKEEEEEGGAEPKGEAAAEGMEDFMDML